MATDLTRIGHKARKEPKLVFTNLFDHVYDVDNLPACFNSLDAHKPTGAGEMLRSARRRVEGYLNYCAITDNSDRCHYYVYRVRRILFKRLNRKSQRKAYT